MHYVLLWSRAFALTLVLEGLLVVPGLRAAQPSLPRRFALLLFANLATHPIVWFVLPEFPLRYSAMVALAELWAFCAEAAFYAMVVERLSWRRGVLLSLAANGLSLLGGIALRKLWPVF